MTEPGEPRDVERYPVTMRSLLDGEIVAIGELTVVRHEDRDEGWVAEAGSVRGGDYELEFESGRRLTVSLADPDEEGRLRVQ